jgi:heat shock protein beta
LADISPQADADEKAKAEGKEGADPVSPVTKTEWKDEEGFKVQNDNKPLWVRSPKEVGKEEYDAFFKTTFR